MDYEFRWLVKGKRPSDETRVANSPDLHDHESKKLQYEKVLINADHTIKAEWVDIPVVYEDDLDGDES